MASDTLNTSFVISFGGSAANSMSAEVDSDPDGLNGGATTFYGGDAVGFLVYSTKDVTVLPPVSTIDNLFSSKQAIAYLGQETRTFWQQVTFNTSGLEVGTSKPADEVKELWWVGNQPPGVVSLSSDGTKLLLKTTTPKDKTPFVCMGFAKMAGTVRKYSVATLAEIPNQTGDMVKNYPVSVYVVGNLPDTDGYPK